MYMYSPPCVLCVSQCIVVTITHNNPFLFSPKSTQGESNKLKQRVATAGSAAAGKMKPQISHSSSSPLNIVAIMLILVAIILGYLVGKWL